MFLAAQSSSLLLAQKNSSSWLAFSASAAYYYRKGWCSDVDLAALQFVLCPNTIEYMLCAYSTALLLHFGLESGRERQKGSGLTSIPMCTCAVCGKKSLRIYPLNQIVMERHKNFLMCLVFNFLSSEFYAWEVSFFATHNCFSLCRLFPHFKSLQSKQHSIVFLLT